jgi:hypothetical protein
VTDPTPHAPAPIGFVSSNQSPIPFPPLATAPGAQQC